MKTIRNILFSMLALSYLVSCAQELGVLEISKPTELLEEPYPMNYGKRRNTAIKILQPQRAIVLEEIYGKDFRAFKIKDNVGDKGYVIDDRRIDFVSKESTAQQ